MAKRKRGQESLVTGSPLPKKSAVVQQSNGHASQGSVSLQVITGSYDRILHGIIATIPGPPSKSNNVHFQDNFLFNAHSSAIRCLALSPTGPEDSQRADKLILATGGTDEKINLYSVSTCLPDAPSLPSLASVSSLENPKNKELGSLLHHDSSVNVLYFPTKGKLISASDDNTIAISRTRDWTLLSSIKAPIPKQPGRPSGDTAPLGGAPSGINDFAVHPSMKLMISVGKGERCMRLWNLVTGKKASVLNFEKELLQSVGEDKRSKSEGQRVIWNSAGDEFAIAFERGVAVFGMDSEVKCIAVPGPTTKIHQIAYTTYKSLQTTQSLLLISTEDGRLLFYTTETSKTGVTDSPEIHKLHAAILRGQLGGRASGVDSRIKDFRIISSGENDSESKIIITAGSNGIVRIWRVDHKELTSIMSPLLQNNHKDKSNGTSENNAPNVIQIGALLGKYNTNNRITCLQAFRLYHNTDTNGTKIHSKSHQRSREQLNEVSEQKEAEEEEVENAELSQEKPEDNELSDEEDEQNEEEDEADETFYGFD